MTFVLDREKAKQLYAMQITKAAEVADSIFSCQLPPGNRNFSRAFQNSQTQTTKSLTKSLTTPSPKTPSPTTPSLTTPSLTTPSLDTTKESHQGSFLQFKMQDYRIAMKENYSTRLGMNPRCLKAYKDEVEQWQNEVKTGSGNMKYINDKVDSIYGHYIDYFTYKEEPLYAACRQEASSWLAERDRLGKTCPKPPPPQDPNFSWLPEIGGLKIDVSGKVVHSDKPVDERGYSRWTRQMVHQWRQTVVQEQCAQFIKDQRMTSSPRFQLFNDDVSREDKKKAQRRTLDSIIECDEEKWTTWVTDRKALEDFKDTLLETTSPSMKTTPPNRKGKEPERKLETDCSEGGLESGSSKEEWETAKEHLDKRDSGVYVDVVRKAYVPEEKKPPAKTRRAEQQIC